VAILVAILVVTTKEGDKVVLNQEAAEVVTILGSTPVVGDKTLITKIVVVVNVLVVIISEETPEIDINQGLAL
jgi:hypothetical protein